MPIYAYRCSTCGHAKDVLRKISDPALTVCPECGAPTFVKQVTAAGFQLKGSGWYVTDFRGDNKTGKDADKGKSGDASAAESTAGGDAAKSGEGKTGESSKSEAAKGESTSAPAPAPAPAASPPPSPTSSSPPFTPSGKTGG